MPVNHFTRTLLDMPPAADQLLEPLALSGRVVHRKVIELIRKLDPSRPVTFASNKGKHDLCLGLVDIVAWNLYDAWYSGSFKDIADNLHNLLDWLHSAQSHGGQDKPVILSEFGAGAIYGYRQPHHAKWTEEYQAQVLDECLRVYLNHPDVVGAAIWQFCDIRVSQDFWLTRPRTMNNKGVFDEFRRPKLSWTVVKQRMQEAASQHKR
jgi:beta-glucuronidase